jgi:hypothetical protein
VGRKAVRPLTRDGAGADSDLPGKASPDGHFGSVTQINSPAAWTNSFFPSGWT